jgi:chromosome partitioning protein
MEHMSGAKIFAVVNDDGKVGKTTTVVNLGACLAEAGSRTLVVDICPRANATTRLGLDSHTIGLSMYELLVDNNVTVAQVVMPEIRPNLSLLPSKVDLYAADIELVYQEKRETRLKRALESVKANYEFVLIDCPPSLGLLTVNALTACDGIILPLECEYDALEGMQQLLNTIRLVRDRLNPLIMLFGIVLTKYDPKTTLGKEVVREISEHFPKEKFDTIIPLSTRLKEASRSGKDILQYDPRSRGAVAYKQLAEEVIARTDKMLGDNHA